MDHLKGAHVDYIESLMGSGFKINNPNVGQVLLLRALFQHRIDVFSFLNRAPPAGAARVSRAMLRLPGIACAAARQGDGGVRAAARHGRIGRICAVQ